MKAQQIVLVKAADSAALITCYERRGDGYKRALPPMRGYVGKHGVTRNKIEGDGKTPQGTFAIGFAFGFEPSVMTRLKYRRIRRNSLWCSDSSSPLYNTWRHRATESQERLWEYKNEYWRGAVIKYNYGSECAEGKGSAIFLHVKNAPTAGCVAASALCVCKILAWLDYRKNPVIVIKRYGMSSAQ